MAVGLDLVDLQKVRMIASTKKRPARSMIFVFKVKIWFGEWKVFLETIELLPSFVGSEMMDEGGDLHKIFWKNFWPTKLRAAFRTKIEF